MTKRKKRVVAVGLVGLVAMVAIVAAAPATDGVEFPQSIKIIRHPVGMGVIGTVPIANIGMTPVTINQITYTCDSTMGLSPPNGGVPITIPPAAMGMLAMDCPPSLGVGMHRCTFTAMDTAKGIGASFLGVCETQGVAVLNVNPMVLNFGNVGVGQTSAIQTFTVTNSGSNGMDVATLQLQVDDPNFLIGSPCNPDATGCNASGIGPFGQGSDATVAVMCKPTKSGMIVGHAHAIGSNGFYSPNTVTLTCNGSGAGMGPAIQVTPTTIDLGNVEVQGGLANGTVAIKNVGSGMLAVNTLQLSSSILGAAMDWTFNVTGKCANVPCSLANQEQINVNLTFNPSDTGARTTDLIIDYNDGAARTTTVELDGIGRGPKLSLLSGSNVNFGIVPLNTMATQQIVIANNGNRNLTDGMISPSPLVPPFAIQANPLIVPVSPPNTTVNVTCFSPTPITQTTAITIDAPDVVGGGFSVNLTCEVRDTQLSVTPTSTQLGELRTGTGATHHLYSVTSLGAPIPVTSVALSSANPNVAIVSSMGAQTTPFMIDLQVDPTMDGPIDTSIVITPMNGMVLPIAIPVTGLVTTAAYTAPAEISLGTFCVGKNTSATNVVLSSTGTATIMMQQPTLQMSPSPFELVFTTPSQYPAQLPGNTQAMVQVTPKRSMVPGPVDDVLEWRTDATPATRTTTLRAEFVDDGGAIAPTQLDFGRVPIHVETPNGQRVTLQNCDTSPLDLDPIHVDEPFAIQGAMPTRLEPGESTSINVVFLPTKVGPANGVLEVTAAQLPGQKLTVALSGEGFVDGGGGGDDDGGFDGDRTSFYACVACNTNNPTGMVAIALAFGIALLPRRRRRAA